MPPGLLITDRRQLVHAFGGAGKFLTHRDGRPTTDILDLVEGNLKLALAGSMQRAAKDLTPVVYSGVRIGSGAEERVHKLTVKPILNRQSNLTHLMILLEEQDAAVPRAQAQTEIDINDASHAHVQSLESELRHTRENLQATIEELETSNEELQASNEELVASNEELQSTNEELHSVNEELYTVNAEYQKKIAQLTEMTDDMDNLLRSTDIATIFLDHNLYIRKFTPQVARIFDLLPQDIGRRIDGFSHHILHATLMEDVMTVVRSGEAIEKQVQHRNGTWFYLRVLPYHSHGRIEGVVLAFINIETLKAAEGEAREAVRRRDQFLAMLSHELRNPLAAVVNASRLLEASQPDQETTELARGTIRRQSAHMARLLDDLLDVSRITRGKIDIRKQIVDLRQSTRDALEAIRPLLDSRSLRFFVDIPDTPVCVSGDPARLQQIQVNLLTNAIRYTPAEGSVWLRVRAEKNEAVISVRDTGAGIPANMREKIFELFVQLDRNVGSSEGGMGVGLTLVQALVELHAGSIEVLSEGRNQGSEFVVRLPTVEAPRQLPQDCSPARPLSGLRVLLVEDNPDIRAVTQRLLASMGCEVSTADCGPKAIEAVANLRPEMALVDIGLPDMDGYEVARQLRRRWGASGLKLVAVTGFGQPDDRERALEAGFEAHLVKPVDIDELLQLLRRLSNRADQAS